jgi:AcrR family transcriptional regulator
MFGGRQAVNRRVTKSDWLEAALQALSETGLRGVAIEPLARGLRVTKGSFYSYFPSLDALIAELLAMWEELATEAVIRSLDAIADPKERLAQLFAASWDRVDHLKAEAALGAAAVAGDPRVRPAYLRVNRRRLAYTRQLYADLGLPPKQAQRFALTAYGAYLGTLQLVALDTGAFGSQSELRHHAAHLADTLLPRSARR